VNFSSIFQGKLQEEAFRREQTEERRLLMEERMGRTFDQMMYQSDVVRAKLSEKVESSKSEFIIGGSGEGGSPSSRKKREGSPSRDGGSGEGASSPSSASKKGIPVEVEKGDSQGGDNENNAAADKKKSGSDSEKAAVVNPSSAKEQREKQIAALSEVDFADIAEAAGDVFNFPLIHNHAISTEELKSTPTGFCDYSSADNNSEIFLMKYIYGEEGTDNFYLSRDFFEDTLSFLVGKNSKAVQLVRGIDIIQECEHLLTGGVAARAVERMLKEMVGDESIGRTPDWSNYQSIISNEEVVQFAMGQSYVLFEVEEGGKVFEKELSQQNDAGNLDSTATKGMTSKEKSAMRDKVERLKKLKSEFEKREGTTELLKMPAVLWRRVLSKSLGFGPGLVRDSCFGEGERIEDEQLALLGAGDDQDDKNNSGNYNSSTFMTSGGGGNISSSRISNVRFDDGFSVLSTLECRVPDQVRDGLWRQNMDRRRTPIVTRKSEKGSSLASSLLGGLPNINKSSKELQTAASTSTLGTSTLSAPLPTGNASIDLSFSKHFFGSSTCILVMRQRTHLQLFLRLITENGLYLSGMRTIYPTQEQIDKSPSILKSQLTGFQANLIIAVRGPNAFELVRDLIGPTPEIARRTDPESLNAKFGSEDD
jgi:hypothetical protein